MKIQLSIISFFLSTLISFQANGQKKSPEGYLFTHDIVNHAPPVANQQKTGTCRSYATLSFLESEIKRVHDKEINLSEMYTVRKGYTEKAQNYVLRQGKAQFSQGGLSHDVINLSKKYGIMPEEDYRGLEYGSEEHNHSEFITVAKGFLEGVIQNKGGALTTGWKPAFEGVLDAYFGSVPEYVNFEGSDRTPKQLADDLLPDLNDYISFTSFTHHPFYEQFVLEVPDNWSNGSYYNVPLNDFMHIVNNALENGFTLAWDGDVSEQTWGRKEGIAVIPESYPKKLSEEKLEKVFSDPIQEHEVDQIFRQLEFKNYNTTDDHLMHIVGTAKDRKQNKYYILKNSWGENAGIEGNQYVSVPYFKLKTISVTVHKDAVPKKILKQFD